MIHYGTVQVIGVHFYHFFSETQKLFVLIDVEYNQNDQPNWINFMFFLYICKHMINKCFDVFCVGSSNICLKPTGVATSQQLYDIYTTKRNCQNFLLSKRIIHVGHS